MQIPRFFLTSAALDFEPGQTVPVDDPAIANQVRNVLRMQPGDHMILLDGRGSLYQCTISAVGPRHLECLIKTKEQATGEYTVDVTIGLAMLRGDRFDWALQKLTEVGVRTIVPLATTRTIPKVDTAGDAKGAQTKLARWQAIVREAAEQCERATIPHIVLPKKIEEFIDDSTAGGMVASTYICAERLQVASLKDIFLDYACGRKDRHATKGGAITLLVGPEGGFTEEEVAYARNAGIMPVSLGQRILRAETAAVYAVAQVIWCLEN
jgi:16S rRNA (uracil1498-N3)-methyltransferase